MNQRSLCPNIEGIMFTKDSRLHRKRLIFSPSLS